MKKSIWALLLVLLFHTFAFSQSTRTELVVKGLILDFDGRPVAGASVTVVPLGTLKGVMPMTKANARGEFSVVVHQTGQFFVTAHKLSDNYPSTANLFYYPYPAPAAIVTVIADQPAPFATVQFGPKAGRILLQVFDAQTNQPIPDVSVNLCRVESPKHCYRFLGDKNGRASTLVPSAPFTMQLAAEGYEDAYGELSSSQGLQPLQVPSETTRQLTISMRKATGVNADVLPAPRIIFPKDGAEFINTPHPRTLKLEWAAVPNAKTYAVDVEVCSGLLVDAGNCNKSVPLQTFREPPQSGIEATSYEFVFPGTQPGRWRVWAVDANGRPGAKSPWTIFYYVWRE